jgi:nicotinamidase-related amidase
MTTRERRQDDVFDPARSALVLVDLQNDFCAAGGRADLRGRDLSGVQIIVPRIREMIQAARWAGCLVFFIQNTAYGDGRLSNDADRARRSSEWGEADPFITKAGTWGHQIIDDLQPQEGDFVVQKYRHSAFTGTNFEMMLRAKSRTSLFVAGVATHACVEATVRDALTRDYDIFLLEDCVAALEKPLHDAGLLVMRALLPEGRVIGSQAVAQIFRDPALNRQSADLST